MRVWTETITRREGGPCGPVDWGHPAVADLTAIEAWKDAEANPHAYWFVTCGGMARFDLHKICMYDGWPYWRPTPAALIVGPTGSSEWRHLQLGQDCGIRKKYGAK